MWKSLLLFGALLPATDAADLIIRNAVIHTMDPARPLASALAVTGNRITAVGSERDVASWTTAETRVVDARGKLLLPGFNDSHVHFLDGGAQLSSVDLRDAKTPDEFSRRIAAFAAKTPPGRWIQGGNWDHESWPGAPLPRRGWIDATTKDTPVFVNRLDGHMSLANTAALKLADVTRDTKSPDGGLIVKDPTTGEPTGVLKDAAMSLVYRVIPAMSMEEKLAAARAATEHAASLGLTSVQEMSTGTDVAVYQELARRGELKTRLYGISPLPEWKRLAAIGITAPFGSGLLRIGGLKGFADGSLGSTTALFFENYNDDPSTSGLPSDEMFPPQAMAERILGADRAGLQVMIHAIGDKANDAILGFYEQANRVNGPRDRRFRIEHAQHLRLADIPRFHAAGVITSMQPYHAIDDGRWAEKRIGAERAKGTYAFRSLLDSGAALAFGSDWPVAPLNPLLGVYAAVTRRTTDGKHPNGWVPSQKITVEETIRAYTQGAAYAEFQDRDKGTLAPGKLADMVLLSRDIFEIDPVEIERVSVELTVMDGKIVFQH
jgi:predicted amidohydrolase YtcJ